LDAACQGVSAFSYVASSIYSSTRFGDFCLLAFLYWGDLLDVGCGEMPFRGMLPSGIRYTGIDVQQAGDFGMHDHDEIKLFDGRSIPFPDENFDVVLCTEVLEHAVDPEALIAEMWRVLRPGGIMLVTVPFSARVHYAPHDYNRFTRYRLTAMFSQFTTLQIEERGDDIAVIANKLIVLWIRLARPSARWWLRWPAAIALMPIAVLFLVIAHLSIQTRSGSVNDPLGYAIYARRYAPSLHFPK
jgi:SAM-dependent methyltransferase